MRMKIIAITSLLLCNFAIGQEIDEFIAINLEKNDITKVLPPLDSLIGLAHGNSPELKYRDADQKYWKARQRLAQTRWLDYFYLEAVYSYGVFDNLTASQLSGAPQASQTLFSTKQDRYTFGPSLKIPISAILNRKNTIRSAKAEAERSVYEKEIDKAQLRELVITRYNALIKAHRLLFVYGSIVDTYKIQSLRAETEYKNGIISVPEYTRLTQMLNEAIVAHEAQKSELSLAILLLEEVVGIKLNI
ncbi:Outer membrane efflux protein [Flagellimonas pacifica]|uniref:Outer membrane efflux protein n=2 Tax=Flagellimonas pacifica TaxID=1247520 RepID=A0A285N0I9_9FLAO|nr:Outer membrane efflux protein [Allomuricauda parva]